MTLGAFLAGASQGVNQGIQLNYMKRMNDRAARQEQRDEEQWQWQKENRELQKRIMDMELDDRMTQRLLMAEDILSEAVDEGIPHTSQEIAGALSPIFESEINQGGPEGSKKELADLDAVPTDRGPVIVPKLNITYADGTTAQKPMTENRSDDPNDQVVGFTIPQLMAARNAMRQRLFDRLGSGALDKAERRRHIEALEALSGGSALRSGRIEAEQAALDREAEMFKSLPEEIRGTAWIARQRGLDIRTAEGLDVASKEWRKLSDRLGLNQQQQSSFVQDINMLRAMFPKETNTKEGLIDTYRRFKSDGADRTLDGLKLLNELDRNREAALKELDPETFDDEQAYLNARDEIMRRYDTTASEIRTYMRGGAGGAAAAGEDPEADAWLDRALGIGAPTPQTDPNAPPAAAGMEWAGARPPLADAANPPAAAAPAPPAAEPAPAAAPEPEPVPAAASGPAMDPRAAAYAAPARNMPSLSMPDTNGLGRSPQAAVYEEQRRLRSQIPAAPEQKREEPAPRRMPTAKAAPTREKPVDNRANRSRSARPEKASDARMETLRAHGRENLSRRQYVKNKDGSISTVRSVTVQDSRLNGGRPTLIPTIWNGFKVTTDRAIERAIRSKKSWPAFDTIEQAAEAAKQLSQELDADLRRENVGSTR